MLDPLAGGGFGWNFNTGECFFGDVGLERSYEATIVRSFDPERASVVLDFNSNAPISTAICKSLYDMEALVVLRV